MQQFPFIDLFIDLFESALYVSGDKLAHLQEHFLTVYRVSQEECARLRESVPYFKVYRYNPKHLYPKLNGYNGYGDNGQRKVGLLAVPNTATCTVDVSRENIDDLESGMQC